MAYIQIISETQADGQLADLYKRFGNPDGTVDNVLKVHSLNPESLQAHCAIYVQSMHKPSPVSRAEREMIGVIVSRINGCDYCLKHHAQGLRRLLPTQRKHITDQLILGQTNELTTREHAMVTYAASLTEAPADMTRADTEALTTAGLTDREVLDVAQVTAYFAYANRIVLGLGAKFGEGEGAIGQWPDAMPSTMDQ